MRKLLMQLLHHRMSSISPMMSSSVGDDTVACLRVVAINVTDWGDAVEAWLKTNPADVILITEHHLVSHLSIESVSRKLSYLGWKSCFNHAAPKRNVTLEEGDGEASPST